MFLILKWDSDVHTEHAADKIERHQNRRDQGDFAQDAVGVGSLRDTVDRKCGEIIAVSTGQNLLKVAQVGRHRNNMVLDVAKVHADVHTRGDLIVLVATLGEASQNIGLATQEAQQSHAVLAGLADGTKERA